MSRILVAECKQEISSFNPIIGTYDNFTINCGDELLAFHQGRETELAGALEVFAAEPDIEVVPTCGARAPSAGPLAQKDFERIAAELLEAIEPHATQADGFYFCLHGAMGCTEELDPEGYLLQEIRKLTGPELPIVISQDLHGILTSRMLEHSNGLAIYHTYPHVDFADTGRRAARLLLQVLHGAEPVVARVRVPALVRGDELITASGVYGESIRYAQVLEEQSGILAAGMMIGNPFTDVPELCSQAIVVADGDEDLARDEALQMAADFWERRAKMQPALVQIEDAVARAPDFSAPVLFTDAADAPSSGATGDSNALVAALHKSGYQGKVLAPLVDAPAVYMAHDAGLGAKISVVLGGSLDSRFSPLKLEVEVVQLGDGEYPSESWDTPQHAGDTAVLQSDNIILVCVSRSVPFVDRSVFLAHDLDPVDYDLIVVKSPHCQWHFFDEWAHVNFNVDAPGSTSANLKTLGHTVCQRPMYPLDAEVPFEPVAEIFA
jgi:microcystin degradation protein MlrC